jgi:hypothetical protein
MPPDQDRVAGEDAVRIGSGLLTITEPSHVDGLVVCWFGEGAEG